MNILVFKPGIRSVEYAFLGAATGQAHNGAMGTSSLAQHLAGLCETLARGGPVGMPDALAIRVNFGAADFRAPALACGEIIRKLQGLIPRAPLHMPAVFSLLEGCRRVFPDLPTVLFFETAFFARLPRREFTYGIDKELSDSLGLRRYGYHGLFHEAACSFAEREQRSRRPQRSGRVLSICLEPHPEIAAVLGHRPVLCTSGATPLEGIPGHTSCGELDPSIVLMIARKLKWGPEQINTVLTQQSGLLGLAGYPVMLDDVWALESEDLEPARSVLQGRILSACGAGMAAMGGVDCIVFSGRFAMVGETLGPWLKNRLTFRGGNENRPPECLCFTESLDHVIAEKTEAFLAEAGMKACA